MATIQGEIRVGPSHQARLPEYKSNTKPDEMPEKCESLEELRWSPKVPDCDLMMYLLAARSITAFAGMCDGGCAENGCVAASRDDTTINAMDTLHESFYDTGKALQALVQNPIPRSIEKKWLEDDQKRFVKGLRQCGKNFFRIKKELLPHKETADLVEYYYLWKKFPGSATSRTHRRNRRQTTLRRIKPNPRQNRPLASDFIAKQYSAEASSGSDEGEDSEDSDSRGGDTAGYTCQNCFTTNSEYWLPVGKDLAVMCSECELYYKKHGEMRPVMESKENLPYLFQPVGEDDDANQGKHVMRTRQSKERQSPKTVVAEGYVTAAKGGRKSPGAASNCSTSSTDRDKKKKTTQDSTQKGKRKIKTEKNADGETEDEKSGTPKKKMPRTDSPSESICTESSVSSEKNAQEGEGMSSPSPSLGPSPALSPCPPPQPVKENLIERTEELAEQTAEQPVNPLATVAVVKEEIDPPEISEPLPITPAQIKQEIVVTKGEEQQEEAEEEQQVVASLSSEMVDTIVEKVKEEVIPPAPILPVPTKEEVESTPPVSPAPTDFSLTQGPPAVSSMVAPPILSSLSSSEDRSPNASIPMELTSSSSIPTPPQQQQQQQLVPVQPQPLPLQSSNRDQSPENSLMPVALSYPGPAPESIKTEVAEMAPTPPPHPTATAVAPPLPPSHETMHHSYSHTSSTAHFSNDISINMSNSSYGQSGSITASSSISVSYQSHHSKLPYPGHMQLMPQSSLSAFGYRPFSPQYPYSPGMPALPYLPPSSQSAAGAAAKMKFSPSPSSSTSQTPPPISPPFTSSSAHSVSSLVSESQAASYKAQQAAESAGSSRVAPSILNLSSMPPSTSSSAGGSHHHTSTSTSSKLGGAGGGPYQGALGIQEKNLAQQQQQQAHHQSPYSSAVEPHPMAAHGGMPSAHRTLQRVPQMPMLHGRGMPMPSQHLPPTSYLSSQLPFQPPQGPGAGPGSHHPPQERPSDLDKCCPGGVPEQVSLEEEEEPESHVVARGPSPEPRVDDAECHRSQSAIFLRHWNRGECNSCARTDLTFKPVPDTKLARKREENARKAAEKERERLKARLDATPEGKPGGSSHGDGHHLSPFESPLSRNGADNSALRQLGEYARPHAASFASPGYARPPQAVGPGNIPLGVLPHGIDPILHYQLSSGMYGAAARERYTLEIEMEREKRERDLQEKLKAEYEMMKSRMPPGAYDPHWVELQRRYGALQAGPSVGVSPGHPRAFGLYSPAERERMGIPPNVPVSEAAAMERMNAERAHSERLMLSTDPLLRLQMAGLAPELHTHAHTHAHAHTHLHLHPHDAVSAAAMGVPPHLLNEPQVHPGSHPLLPPTGYAPGGPRPANRNELLHPAATGMLRPPYDEQLAHQLSAQLVHHEQLQRQLLIERERQFLIERERSAHMGAQMTHQSQLISQQEEYIRQQREREAKYRSLEEWKKHLGDGGGHP